MDSNFRFRASSSRLEAEILLLQGAHRRWMAQHGRSSVGLSEPFARKWRKTGIFPPFRDAPRVKSVVWRNQVSSKINGLV
jgi:hypothetical protein